MYPNNNGFMQNTNWKTKESITQKTQRFTWFGFWLMFIGDVKEKIWLTKERDYKGGTKTHSQSPNPKYTQRALNHQKHVTRETWKSLKQSHALAVAELGFDFRGGKIYN